MTKKNATNFKLKLILATGLIYSTSACSGEDPADTTAFLKDVSQNAITLHCGDQSFLDLASLEARDCPNVLGGFSKQCNRLVLPLIPAVSGTEEDAQNVEKLKSLGELYSLCLRALAYEAN
jgi:hypothetical protein